MTVVAVVVVVVNDAEYIDPKCGKTMPQTLPVVLVLDHVYQSLADRQPEEEPRQLPRPPVCLTVIPPGLCTRVSLSSVLGVSRYLEEK